VKVYRSRLGPIRGCEKAQYSTPEPSLPQDGLLRQLVYLGEREDKPAAEVRRERP
jgi:hypothetical protein